MIEISFFDSLWIAFALVALGTMVTFFARRFQFVLIGSAVALSGISIQFLATDIFRSSGHWTGKGLVLAVWFLFVLQAVAYRFCLTTTRKMNKVLFGFAFLAFITLAISLDLITVLLGLTLFNLSFLMLDALRGADKTQLLISIQKSCVAFLSFAYGMAILFCREGSFAFSYLRLKLAKGDWDNLTTLGVGLLALAVLIQVYTIIPLVKVKKSENV